MASKEKSAAEKGLGVRSLPSMNAILEALLLCKALISFSELDDGDAGIDLLIFAQRQTLERMIVAVSGELFPLEIG